MHCQDMHGSTVSLLFLRTFTVNNVQWLFIESLNILVILIAQTFSYWKKPKLFSCCSWSCLESGMNFGTDWALCPSMEELGVCVCAHSNAKYGQPARASSRELKPLTHMRTHTHTHCPAAESYFSCLYRFFKPRKTVEAFSLFSEHSAVCPTLFLLHSCLAFGLSQE